MVQTSKQNWELGQTVKVGFLALRIIAVVPTPGDYRPDQYRLIDGKGRTYTFTPHFGLERE